MKELDKRFDFLLEEPKIYSKWEKSGFFKPEINSSNNHYSIILPPPNANANLHLGHALYTTEDILIRYHRMIGDETLWLPGADHAGFETQFVFEKHLKKQGKSRFDYDRETFYKEVLDFVLSNRKNMQNQLRQLGFSLDWTRDKFTLDPDIISTVYDTFIKLYNDKLIYKGERVGNFCIKCGTAFSDLEIVHQEEEGNLWYINYPLVDEPGFIQVATTRPETMLGDTAVAVNPKDPRYKKLIGKKVHLPLTNRTIPIIPDLVVDPKFGTGAVKVTPAHSDVDYDIYTRNKEIGLIQVINTRGKINENAPEKYQGLKVIQAREAIIEDLKKESLLVKTEPHKHAVTHCYKCGGVIEPLPLPQWFLKMKSLSTLAINAVKDKKTKIIPKRFEKIYFNWLENIRDWPISRQLWFGIRIPVWYCQDCHEVIVNKTEPKSCTKCHSTNLKQEEDTFDTWFSSGQWPYATLKNTNPGDFDKFYPTSVMGTAYDIIFFWVARMVMFGLYLTEKVPFENVYFYGLVRDKFGKKMSKSKGNVINPSDMIEKYGADALRFSLVASITPGNDQSISEDKIRGYRNFITKVYNGARFVLMQLESFNPEADVKLTSDDNKKISELNEIVKKVTENINQYQFGYAATDLYEYYWHNFCDKIIEEIKPRIQNSTDKNDKLSAQFTLYTILKTSMLLLHPFIPFVTEAVWQKIPKTPKDKESIMISSWPTNK